MNSSNISPNSLPSLAEIRAEQCRRDFGRWLKSTAPTWHWDWAHLAYVRQKLAGVTDGDILRLAIFLPPQHGKSQMTTVRYPVWRLERDASLRVAVACYNQTHANRFSRRSLSIARDRGIVLEPSRQSAEEWDTTDGGGLRAVGVGSGITGNPVDLLVIDDPVKSREEAESEAYRQRCWDWYADDLYTRLQPEAAIILIMTRWHQDDLAGRILSGADADSWTVVNLPAEAEDDDPLGRNPGEALCPERFDLEALTDRRRVLGPSYYALYQQRPVPREGGMILRAWLSHTVPAAPRQCAFVRYWDKAGTAGGGAYTAGVLLARDKGGIFYVVDVVRGQWAAVDRERVIRQTAEQDRQAYGHVRISVEQEPGSGGKESAESTIRNLAGFSALADRPTGDKEVRLEPFAAQAGSLNVRLVIGRWNSDYIDELCTFPAGRYRDQADATSGAFNRLATVPVDASILIPAKEYRNVTGSMPAVFRS